MILAGILLFMGLLMVFMEFYLPGGVMGVIGGALLIGAVVVFSLYSPHPFLSFGFGIVVTILFILLVRFALLRIRHSRPESSIYLSTDQEGTKASTFDEERIGQEGTALTSLRPSGHIEIEGKRFQAVSRMGYINQGTKVRVIAGDGGHLVVQKTE